MKLRSFTDKSGLQVELMSLKLSYVYEGLIEGSRSGAHEVFKRNIERELKSGRAFYVVGFSEPDAKVEKRWSNPDQWPPAELVEARCRSKWVPNGKHPHGHTSMTIKWYQDDGDPFSYLAQVIKRISWAEYSEYIELVD
jgi:hypothetical protein